MARVLFINGGSEGHINPTIGVVQELVSRGEEVVYFCIEAFRERIENTGATVRTFDDQKFIQAFLSGGRTYLMERINGLLLTADVVIPSVLEQIEGESFDYMIHDSMFGCGHLLARILDIPSISSCTSFAQIKASFESMLEKVSAAIPSEELNAIKDRYDSLTASVKKKYGVELHSPYEVFCNPAPLTIVYTVKEIQPDGDAFDHSYRFVGPSIASRAAQDSFDFTAIEGKSVIYISLGTVFNQAVDFYKQCFESFGGTEHTVVMSVGSRTSIHELGEIPGNFIVEHYVPQMNVLSHARLFITHGGMNSAHEGLYCGVPLIVIPQSADQPVVATQVSRVGAGLALQMQGLTVAGLREAADQVLGEVSFKAAALEIRGALRQAGGYRQAVDDIFEFRGRHARG